MLHAKDIKYAVIGTPQFKWPENATKEQWVVSIMKDVDYNPEIMKQRVANKIQNNQWESIQLLFSIHEDDKMMFSVELVGAVCSIHSLFRVLFHSVNLSGHMSRVVCPENGSVALDKA